MRTEVQSSNKSAPTIRGQPKGGTLNYDRRSESRRDDVETQGLPSLVQGRHRHARELCTSPQSMQHEDPVYIPFCNDFEKSQKNYRKLQICLMG